MNRNKILTIVILFFIVCLLFVSLGPGIWYKPVLGLVNQHILKKRGYTVSAKHVHGYLFGSITAEETIILGNDGSTIIIPTTRLSLDWSTLVRGVFALKQLHFDDIIITVPELSQKTGPKNNLTKIIEYGPESIQDLKIKNCKIEYVSPDTSYGQTINFDGKMTSFGDGLEFNIQSFHVYDYHDILDEMYITGGKILILPDSITVHNFKAKYDTYDISGDLNIKREGSNRLNGNILVSNIEISDLIDTTFQITDDTRPFSVFIDFVSDLKTVNGSIKLENKLNLNWTGNFAVEIQGEIINIHNLVLSDNQFDLRYSGIYDPNHQSTGELLFNQIDLSHLAVGIPSTKISGMVLMEFSTMNDSITDISASFEIEEASIYNNQPIQLSGILEYHQGLLQFQEPMSLSLGSSSLTLEGDLNINLDQADLRLKMEKMDIVWLKPLWNGPPLSGIADGSLILKGDMKSPSINADLNLHNFSIFNHSIESMKANLNINNIWNDPIGEIHATVGKGIWNQYFYDNATIDIQLDSTFIDLEQFHIVSGKNYLQLSGSMKNNSSVTINRLQIAYNGHYSINPGQIMLDVDLNTKKIELKPFVLHVDDGIIEGVFSNQEDFEGLFKLSNIESGILSLFHLNDFLQINGLVFGEIGFEKKQDSMNATVDVSLKKGSIIGQPFDDLVVSLLIKDDLLFIDDLSLIYGKISGAQMSGVVPFELDPEKDVPIIISSRLNNIESKIFTQFLTDWFDMSGIISGEININGTTQNMPFDYDLDIKNASFDIIPLGQVKGKGSFDGHYWLLESFSSTQPKNQLDGFGKLPVDLNLGSKNRGQFYNGDTLWLDVSGRKSNLDFITNYFSITDSLIGEIALELQLRGVPEHIIRHGSGEIRNGILFTEQLDDPIKNINSTFIVQNNQFKINKFRAEMLKGKSVDKEANIFITGGMDLTSFFYPRMNFHGTGNDVYFSSLIDNLSGFVDIDLFLTGRDTIVIAGDIPVINVEMTEEFTSVTNEEMLDENEIPIEYKLSFPITGELNLINQQVDCRLYGEVSMYEFGNREADYSGELFIRDGRFYYSGGIFKDLNGYMVFDGKGFNPYLDFTGHTKIDDEVIYISLVGPLEDPLMNLTSSSGFPPSDILELLTWRKRFEEQELSFTGFGNQAPAILGAWLEGQLEKNFIELTRIEQMGIIDDVSITGAGGLISQGKDEEFAIKAQMTDKISLNYAYRRSFSLSNADQHMLGVEYRYNRYISFVGNIDRTGKFQAKYRLRYSY